jgi:DUF1365 family protein
MPTDSSALASCLYEGVVRHRRYDPVRHEFAYRVGFLYLDLSELNRVLSERWFWSTSRVAPVRFRREDYLGSANMPLDEAVREVVEQRLGFRPRGPIRLLTQPRYFGYVINPVSFYYCFNVAGTGVEAIVAEVTNTPWGERQTYVLPGSPTERGRAWHARHGKELHVSPFFPMAMEYHWLLRVPDERLTLAVSNWQAGRKRFDACLHLRRRPITGVNLARSLARHPFMTGRIAAAIYWQALRLWWKGVPFVPHPKYQTESPRDDTAEGSSLIAHPASCTVMNSVSHE